MSFAEHFWSSDYALGPEALFAELYEGIKENNDFILLFLKRMELEHSYGTQLSTIDSLTKKTSKRHTDDDYVSTIKNAYEKITETFSKQGSFHLDRANNIKSLVLDPFSQWSLEHEERVSYSEAMIQDKNKAFKSAKSNLERLQKRYFNKCRMLEEFKAHYPEEDLDALAEAAQESHEKNPTDDEKAESEENQSFSLGGVVHDYAHTKDILTQMLTTIELKSHKVPILGTYHNVSTGAAITQWTWDNVPDYQGNVAKAERFGQDLIDNGFIRLIGSMSANKSFINSSQFYYQWKPIVFEITKLSELDISNKQKNPNNDAIAASNAKSNQFAYYFEDVKQAMGIDSVDYKDKSQFGKLLKEVEALDSQYFQQTKDFDKLRCDYEEIIMDHLTFMTKCELDRLKAVKKVTFDFLATFADNIVELKKTCDELFVVEETIHPVNDLKFLIKNYATGRFDPHVLLYDNYYNSNIRQTFGVDLNVKSRLDKKAVPILVQSILLYLDEVYPELENDVERTNLWTQPVHLSKVHQVRLKLNELSDQTSIQKVLRATDPMTLTNVFKLYFLELPDSIVPHNYFDLIKTLYLSYPVSSEDKKVDKTRINGLQNTLSELPVSNLATLDAILTHFNRLVSIIASKNEDLGKKLRERLFVDFGSLILRPKENSNGFSDAKAIPSSAIETLQQNFAKDLFDQKDVIFGELRRKNSNKPLRESSSSSKSGLTTRASIAASSKSRLESKLKRAVSHQSEPEEENEKEKAEPPATPQKLRNSSPDKSASGLKRSSSPNKKKLSTLLANTTNGDEPKGSNVKAKLNKVKTRESSNETAATSLEENSSTTGKDSGPDEEIPPIVPPKQRKSHT